MRVLPLPIALFGIGACGPGGDDKGRGTSPDTAATPVAAEPLCQVSVECPGNILNDPKAPCTMKVDDGEGVVVYDGPAAFELRGRSSLTFPKPQYSIELREHHELPVWPGSEWKYLDD